ncbi:tetratricopeptide repeat protein [Methanosarcina sp. UBA289]|uniref:tetratricopeptide repeat protein n=1 Tax=Methanosarcina sp. UBA289 TaxID=1915574 RepID=UPI0025F455F3|nr:tetratricopeptide repeat protein [Methanosarcina sp. UBA289]
METVNKNFNKNFCKNKNLCNFDQFKVDKKYVENYIKKNLDKLLYNLGIAYSGLENNEKAIEAFNLSTKVNSNYALAYNNKGNIFVKMGKYGNAIEAYTKATDINKKYSIAYNNRGQVYFNIKDYKKSLEDFDNAIESNPSNYNAWTNKGAVFFYQKEYGKAKEAFEKALKLKPDYALANVYLAKIFLYLGSSELSYEKINKALDFDIRNADAWRLKGQLQLKDKKYEEAVESFDHAFQYSKVDLFLVLWKAYAHYLEVLDQESLSSENKEEKPQVVWSRETKSIDERVIDVSKKVINSLPLKPNNSQSSNRSSDKKEDENSKFKNEHYSIIRELEMYSSVCCKGKEIPSHVVLDMLADFFFWVKKNIELLFLPIFRYFLIKSISFKIIEEHFKLINSTLVKIKGKYLKSINSTLENYELENVKSYVLYLLGCLYYKVGDYFEAKIYLEECIKQGPKHIKKSASPLFDYISTNYIRSPWWTWWLSSPTYHWTKRVIFTFSSFGFIVLLLFHPFIYSILFKFIYLSQFKDFFIETNITSNMTNNITSNMTNNTTIPKNLTETITENKSVYNNTLTKSNEIFVNFDSFPVNNILYYVLVSIPIFILFSPHISKLTFKTPPVEMEMKSPKDFEFILYPCLMDDVVRKIDDIPES